ncbi:Mitochondrial porin [Coelomomyces lativittatus]|nr:Mitochondrial porin [Coelomomyces lativittatus]KAJ1505666.1 Mitochondrial porin [Coelomomyces lativittatus]KAJ1506141.1 Mitochondrial porin [Coelomomyces lativittatus]
MPPIVFTDIGKAANDLLVRDFPVGAIKLEGKSVAKNGVAFNVAGAKDNKTGQIFGELKTKYTDKEKGLSLTETWTTSNVLSAEVEFADAVTKGLKFNLFGALHPHDGQKNTRLSMEYKHKNVSTRTQLDVFKGPLINADVAVSHDGFMIGAESAYKNGSLLKYNFALGYATHDYALALQIANKGDLLTGSYYHRVNDDVETGAKAVWDRKASANMVLEVGAKYTLDKDTSLKFKIDNSGKLGLGFTQVLKPSVKMSLGGIFDTSKLNENAHKVGMALSFG